MLMRCLFTVMSTCNWILIHYTFNGLLVGGVICSIYFNDGIILNVTLFHMVKGVSCLPWGIGVIWFEQMQCLFKELSRIAPDLVQSKLNCSALQKSTSLCRISSVICMYNKSSCATDVATQLTAARWMNISQHSPSRHHWRAGATSVEGNPKKSRIVLCEC